MIANLVLIIDIYIYIYILRLLLHSFTYPFICCFFSLFMHMLLILLYSTSEYELSDL